ncbi:MAG: hypothetical protein U0X76_11640 [Bacteroidia bacterium]
MKKTILAILAAMGWISISEFVRNQFLLQSYWVNHYQSMGLAFPAASINGAMWGVWSLVFAIFIFIISKKFTLLETTFISWLAGFVMMWLVIGNLNVLPFGILPYAVPLSLLEAFLASWLVKKIT